MSSLLTSRIKDIIAAYDDVVKRVDEKASKERGRAYGGIIRARKGKLQEGITEEIIKAAWENIGGRESRLSVNSKKFKIPIKEDYVLRIRNEEARNYILSNMAEYYYLASVDKQVFIDGDFVIGIECKAYTENAMMKRILVDFTLLKTKFPDIGCYLFQLESQLSGDYSSNLGKNKLGSKRTHTLMSYFPEVDLQICTLLEGERKVDEPIHKPEFFKPLTETNIKKAIDLLSDDLKQYC